MSETYEALTAILGDCVDGAITVEAAIPRVLSVFREAEMVDVIEREQLLTEVETCTIRVALRRLAESTPESTDAGMDRRDVRRLADRLDQYVRMRVSS